MIGLGDPRSRGDARRRGECVSDLGAVREQEALVGKVASDSTAFRVVDRIAAEPELLDALRAAHARARERFWRLDGCPSR
jgi:hypothetical protein